MSDARRLTVLLALLFLVRLLLVLSLLLLLLLFLLLQLLPRLVAFPARCLLPFPSSPCSPSVSSTLMCTKMSRGPGTAARADASTCRYRSCPKVSSSSSFFMMVCPEPVVPAPPEGPSFWSGAGMGAGAGAGA